MADAETYLLISKKCQDINAHKLLGFDQKYMKLSIYLIHKLKTPSNLNASLITFCFALC